MSFSILICVFLCLSLLILSVMKWKEEKQERIAALVEGTVFSETATRTTPKWMSQMVETFARIFPSRLETIERQIRHAGLQKTTAQGVILWSLVAALFLLLLSIIAPNITFFGHLIFGVLCAVIGYLSPFYVLIWPARSARQANIRKQTRNFLLSLTVIAKTGIRFDQAFAEAVESTDKQFRHALEQMQAAMRTSWTIPEAFSWLANNTGTKELELVSVIITQSHENNSDYAESLVKLIDAMDKEQENKVESLSQSINMKVTFIVLFLIVAPIFGFWLMISGKSMMDGFQNF